MTQISKGTPMLTGPQRHLLRSYTEREHVIHGRRRGPDHLRLVELLYITEHPVNGELLIKVTKERVEPARVWDAPGRRAAKSPFPKHRRFVTGALQETRRRRIGPPPFVGRMRRLQNLSTFWPILPSV